ncbi:MAG: PucR family transcriptional regulator [Anaeroplasmataceae bacterium]
MAVTLQRLFADCKNKYNIELIAGSLGMKNLVRWVHIVEDADVPSFLHGNELVFTTGIGIASKSDFNFVNFAQSLIYHGSSGWVINIGPYIPAIPPELIEFCNKMQFPLFTIPWNMRLIDVTYDYSHMIIENEERENSIAKALSNLIYNLGSLEDNIDVLLRGGYKPTDSPRIISIIVKNDDKQISSDNLASYLFNLESSISTNNRYSIIIENNVLIVFSVNITDNELTALIEQIKASLKKEYDNISFNIGISSELIGLDKLPKLYKQSIIAAKTAKMLKSEKLAFSDCGLYQLIYFLDDNVKQKYIDSVLGPIIEYDKEKNTNYLLILKLYIEHNCGIQEIADILGVHRNTINYKIKFIKDNFKINLDIKEMATLWMAISIKEVLENMEE